MFFQIFQKKTKGVFVPGLVAGLLIVGLLSVSVATITSTTFSTLGGAKTASQAQQFGQVETEYMKVMGYNNVNSLIHERKSMEDLVGEEGKKYQSRVEVADTTSNGEGRTVKVLKINVYKGDELNSRYSEEVPLVSGLDYSEKFDALNALIDALTNRVNALEINLNNLSADLANLANRVTRAENNIAIINSNLDRLEELINNNADAIKANKAAIDKNTQDISNISTQLIQVKGDISDLRSSLSNLSTRLEQEIADRQAGDTNLQNNINTLQGSINTVKADLASLKTSVDVITGRLNGKEFVRNKDKVNDISLNYENGDDGNKTIVAYVDGTKVPLSSQGSDSDSPTPDTFTDKGGYYIMPNGLILQWGREFLVQKATWTQVQFPIKFPHKLLTVTNAPVGGNVPTTWEHAAVQLANPDDDNDEKNREYFQWYCEDGFRLFWMAIGY